MEKATCPDHTRYDRPVDPEFTSWQENRNEILASFEMPLQGRLT